MLQECHGFEAYLNIPPTYICINPYWNDYETYWHNNETPSRSYSRDKSSWYQYYFKKDSIFNKQIRGEDGEVAKKVWNDIDS